MTPSANNNNSNSNTDDDDDNYYDDEDSDENDLPNYDSSDSEASHDNDNSDNSNNSDNNSSEDDNDNNDNETDDVHDGNQAHSTNVKGYDVIMTRYRILKVIAGCIQMAVVDDVVTVVVVWEIVYVCYSVGVLSNLLHDCRFGSLLRFSRKNP